MGIQECIKFANENPVCYIATMDGDQPRVRTVLHVFATENGFYYTVLTPKRVYEQLKVNPKMEVCYYNNPAQLPDCKQMRVTGEIEWVDEEEANAKALADRTFIDQIIGKPVKPLLAVFRIAHGEAHFWTLNDILKERELERITF